MEARLRLKTRMLSFGVYSRRNTGMHSEMYKNSFRRPSWWLPGETRRPIPGGGTENRGVRRPSTSTGSTSVHVTKIHSKRKKKTLHLMQKGQKSGRNLKKMGPAGKGRSEFSHFSSRPRPLPQFPGCLQRTSLPFCVLASDRSAVPRTTSPGGHLPGAGCTSHTQPKHTTK